MKFKVGDRVKHKEFGKGNIVYYCKSKNQPYLVEFDKSNPALHNGSLSGKKYKEEHCWWCYEQEMQLIKPKQFTKSDLQDGDIVTQRDGRHKKVCGKNLEGIYEYTRLSIENYTEDLLDKDGDADFDIIKVERPPKNIEIVYERKEEILDKAEKEYLSGVIRPFRDEVNYIRKNSVRKEKEYLSFNFKDGDFTNFKNFKTDSMYKGMKLNKMYTLEELGL